MSLSCRQEHQLPPRQSWRAPVRPSSRRNVRRVRQAACGRRHARLRAGGPGARQPQPPPASPRLEHGGADRRGRGDPRPAQQGCRLGHRPAHQLPPREQARLRSPRGIAQFCNRGALSPRLMRIG